VAKEEKPLQVSWVGVTAKYKQFSSNIRGSYELERKLYYYNPSANYTITPLTWVELGYFRENNPLHPGYHYEDGIKTQFSYNNGLGSYFNVALFDGEIGRGDKEKEPVDTKLATIYAERYLFDDWGK
jgi:hypothetical protein